MMARELEGSSQTAGVGGRPFRVKSLAFFVAVVLLAIIANRDARRGYFEDDDLATLTWTPLVSLEDFVWNIPTLKYPPEHSRPVGYLFFGVLDRRAGLDYPPYVIALDLIHILNIGLLWLLLRKLGLYARACAV